MHFGEVILPESKHMFCKLQARFANCILLFVYTIEPTILSGSSPRGKTMYEHNLEFNVLTDEDYNREKEIKNSRRSLLPY
jgi:hypothetical protein